MDATDLSIDRLNALPDDVVCHILSFLPTKLSVSTCVLSRRWRSLWAHVPTLDLNSNDHLKTSFPKFVKRVMSLHKVQSLNTFRLSDKINYKEDKIETWIKTAVERNVRNVDMCLHYRHTLPRVRPLFTCKTLVHLRLFRCEANVPSGTVSLPSLKTLHLCSVEVGEALPHLLYACQVLEELIIQNISIGKSSSDCFDISSLTIKRLTVGFTFDWDNIYWKVKINAPALRYLKVNNCLRKRISVSPMNSLTEADIRLKIYSLDSGDNMPSQVKFLDCLRNVKCLRLAGYIDKAVTESIVKFDNLTKLELDLVVDWRLLLKLLESADNLEALVVDISLTFWEEPERVPTCLLLHLRIIRTGPICGKHEFNMLRYLARNAKVLKAIDLRSTHCSKAQLDVIKRILLFKRGYEACMLV